MAVFEVSRGAQRRAAIRESLPTDRPPVLDEVAGLLAGVDVDQLGPHEVVGSIAAVAAVRHRCEALLTALAARADADGLSQLFCAGATGTMVAAATVSNPAVGSGTVATGRALRDLPHTEAAFRAGRISVGHVRVLIEASARVEGFAALEEVLVGLAMCYEPAEVHRLVDLLIAQSTPEALDRDLQTMREKRGLSVSETLSGMFKVNGWLDPVEGRRLRDALMAFMDRRQPGDSRNPKQRRADALGDLVSAASSVTRPLGTSGLSVLVDLEHLPHGATLDDGLPIGPATFELLCCTVALSVVFGVNRKGTFVPLHLRRAARRASAAQWAALIARDRGCIRCGRHPRNCEAHHIVHWKDGGFTDLPNLVLLCSRCHKDLHAGHYTVRMDANGVPVITASRAPPAHTG